MANSPLGVFLFPSKLSKQAQKLEEMQISQDNQEGDDEEEEQEDKEGNQGEQPRKQGKWNDRQDEDKGMQEESRSRSDSSRIVASQTGVKSPASTLIQSVSQGVAIPEIRNESQADQSLDNNIQKQILPSCDNTQGDCITPSNLQELSGEQISQETKIIHSENTDIIEGGEQEQLGESNIIQVTNQKDIEEVEIRIEDEFKSEENHIARIEQTLESQQGQQMASQEVIDFNEDNKILGEEEEGRQQDQLNKILAEVEGKQQDQQEITTIATDATTDIVIQEQEYITEQPKQLQQTQVDSDKLHENDNTERIQQQIVRCYQLDYLNRVKQLKLTIDQKQEANRNSSIRDTDGSSSNEIDQQQDDNECANSISSSKSAKDDQSGSCELEEDEDEEEAAGLKQAQEALSSMSQYWQHQQQHLNSTIKQFQSPNNRKLSHLVSQDSSLDQHNQQQISLSNQESVNRTNLGYANGNNSSAVFDQIINQNDNQQINHSEELSQQNQQQQQYNTTINGANISSGAPIMIYQSNSTTDPTAVPNKALKRKRNQPRVLRNHLSTLNAFELNLERKMQLLDKEQKTKQKKSKEENVQLREEKLKMKQEREAQKQLRIIQLQEMYGKLIPISSINNSHISQNAGMKGDQDRKGEQQDNLQNQMFQAILYKQQMEQEQLAQFGEQNEQQQQKQIELIDVSEEQSHQHQHLVVDEEQANMYLVEREKIIKKKDSSSKSSLDKTNEQHRMKIFFAGKAKSEGTSDAMLELQRVSQRDRIEFFKKNFPSHLAEGQQAKDSSNVTDGQIQQQEASRRSAQNINVIDQDVQMQQQEEVDRINTGMGKGQIKKDQQKIAGGEIQCIEVLSSSDDDNLNKTQHKGDNNNTIDKVQQQNIPLILTIDSDEEDGSKKQKKDENVNSIQKKLIFPGQGNINASSSGISNSTINKSSILIPSSIPHVPASNNQNNVTSIDNLQQQQKSSKKKPQNISSKLKDLQERDKQDKQIIVNINTISSNNNILGNINNDNAAAVGQIHEPAGITDRPNWQYKELNVPEYAKNKHNKKTKDSNITKTDDKKLLQASAVKKSSTSHHKQNENHDESSNNMQAVQTHDSVSKESVNNNNTVNASNYAINNINLNHNLNININNNTPCAVGSNGIQQQTNMLPQQSWQQQQQQLPQPYPPYYYQPYPIQKEEMIEPSDKLQYPGGGMYPQPQQLSQQPQMPFGYNLFSSQSPYFVPAHNCPQGVAAAPHAYRVMHPHHMNSYYPRQMSREPGSINGIDIAEMEQEKAAQLYSMYYHNEAINNNPQLHQLDQQQQPKPSAADPRNPSSQSPSSKQQEEANQQQQQQQQQQARSSSSQQPNAIPSSQPLQQYPPKLVGGMPYSHPSLMYPPSQRQFHPSYDEMNPSSSAAGSSYMMPQYPYMYGMPPSYPPSMPPYYMQDPRMMEQLSHQHYHEYLQAQAQYQQQQQQQSRYFPQYGIPSVIRQHRMYPGIPQQQLSLQGIQQLQKIEKE